MQIWDRALQELPQHLNTVQWVLGTLQRMQAADRSGHPRAAAASAVAQQQLRSRGYWDGTMSTQEAIEEVTRLLQQAPQIASDHRQSKTEGIRLALQRQAEEENSSESE